MTPSEMYGLFLSLEKNICEVISSFHNLQMTRQFFPGKVLTWFLLSVNGPIMINWIMSSAGFGLILQHKFIGCFILMSISSNKD